MTDELYNHLKELEPLKIEFTDKDDKYHRLSTYIKRVDGDYILINPPETGGILYEVPDNSRINLIFTRNDGVLIAQCEFLGKQLGVQSGIKISYPYDTQVLERREYVRVPLKLRTKISYYAKRDSVEKESVYVVTRNISGSGMCFFHPDSMENLHDIQCKIFLNDGNPKPVAVKCDHVYSKKARVKNKLYHLIALKYRSVSEEDSARIVKECFKYQISHKHVE